MTSWRNENQPLRPRRITLGADHWRSVHCPSRQTHTWILAAKRGGIGSAFPWLGCTDFPGTSLPRPVSRVPRAPVCRHAHRRAVSPAERRLTYVVAYLDHAATTPVRPEALEAYLTAPAGNASSLHTTGRHARRVLEEARESLAEDLGIAPDDIIFTSGGTTADNLAIKGIATARVTEDPGRRLVAISAVEHHAVLDAAMALVDPSTSSAGFEIVELPVDGDARVRIDAVEALVAERAGELALISVMSANNEVGAAQPIAEIARIAAAAGIPLHSDAVQSVGWWGMPDAPVAAVSISGHKFGAPVGVGALVLPPTVPCQPLIDGGGQERRIHSGTLDVAGASAMAAALHASLNSGEASGEPGLTVSQLRAELVAAVLAAVPDAEVLTPTHGSLPGITSVHFDGCDADALLMLLDAQDVECSTGSACTAGIPEPSHVVVAMGCGEQAARSVLRFSLGWTSTRADIAALAAALPEAVARARRASRGSRRAS